MKIRDIIKNINKYQDTSLELEKNDYNADVVKNTIKDIIKEPLKTNKNTIKELIKNSKKSNKIRYIDTRILLSKK